MPIVHRLPDILRVAASLPDLARRLGAVCLDHSGTFEPTLADPDIRREFARLVTYAEAVDPRAWRERRELNAGYLSLVASVPGFDDAVRDTDAYGPIAHYALLRGLCAAALPDFYAHTTDQVPLDRGSPVPWVSRPITSVIAAPTPHASTMTHGHPLSPYPFELFPFSSGGTVRVVLDYTYRARLDALTWDAATRHLPRIATIHPALGKNDLAIGTPPTSETFFDAGPKAFSLPDLLDQLHAAREKGIEIAVLPELSLVPDNGLGEALAAAPPGHYPALVVGGSAHVRETLSNGRPVRANESLIYLDGVVVARHRKIHPYVLKDERGRREEDLTGEPKTIQLLSGTHTRLAVVICADLNDGPIQMLLQAAWVNLLLVPALTDGLGAFVGAASSLASSCQAIAVIANGARPPMPNPDGPVQPFHALVAVPRSDPQDQVRMHVAPRGPLPARGTFNPNVEPSRAMTWR
jgi:hypothetical protein